MGNLLERDVFARMVQALRLTSGARVCVRDDASHWVLATTLVADASGAVYAGFGTPRLSGNGMLLAVQGWRQVIDQYDFQLPDPFRALQPPLEPRTRAPFFDAFAMAFSADAWTLVLCVQEIEGDSLVASGVFVYSRAVASAECTTR